MTFREGHLLAARFEDSDRKEAIYAMLSEKERTFRYIFGLSEALLKTLEFIDFIMI